MFKRILAGLLSTVLITGTAAIISGCDQDSSTPVESGQNSSDPVENKTVDSIATGTILQCFCWDFNTIKESMADIAAAGFTSIQTSPINECLEGENGGMELYGNGKWYYHYQPTDFKIGNYQLGTRDEFKAMCEEADKYGISVLVDVIANHTTPTTEAISQDLIDAGGGSLETLYHEGNANDLNNYSNRLDCTTYKMGGLPDINTERPSFQDYFFEFINDCIECGADGFRYDTAKHIGLPDDPKEDDGFENNFWEKATTSVNNADSLFIYGEVLQGNNDRIKDYISAIGRTTASTYGSKIRSAISNNVLTPGSVSDYWLGDIEPNVVTWVESHDNYINDGTAYNLSNDQIILGWSIITARKDGTPLFFDRPYNSSMDNIWGMNRIGTQGDDIYKDSRVKAVNFFRTAMQGEDEKLVTPGDDTTALIIERGNKGAVIVNTEGDLKIGFEIGLADGTYIDRVDNKTTYTVLNGKLTSDADIPANSVVVLYNEGYKESAEVAEVGVAEDTEFYYENDSIDVKLTCSNTEDAAYSIDGAEPVSFKDGDKLTIKHKNDSDITEIVLTATNSEGAKTYEKLAFTYKQTYEIKKDVKVYFEKPDDWDDEIYAYVYNDYLDENDDWPGVEMEKTSDGKYCYVFTNYFETPYIIFNDGDSADSVQYPEGRGLVVEPDKTYTVE
ncbi:MAG: starch-binding protein [Ruminococcus sp.]|nr:starch-binding protein [Ruminococcus sp.]